MLSDEAGHIADPADLALPRCANEAGETKSRIFPQRPRQPRQADPGCRTRNALLRTPEARRRLRKRPSARKKTLVTGVKLPEHQN